MTGESPSQKPGVDLRAFDNTTNTHIAVEVKSTMHQTFGQAPSSGPEVFLRQRVDLAVEGDTSRLADRPSHHSIATHSPQAFMNSKLRLEDLSLVGLGQR